MKSDPQRRVPARKLCSIPETSKRLVQCQHGIFHHFVGSCRFPPAQMEQPVRLPRCCVRDFLGRLSFPATKESLDVNVPHRELQSTRSYKHNRRVLKYASSWCCMVCHSRSFLVLPAGCAGGWFYSNSCCAASGKGQCAC